jgi:hypothetical protein
LPGYGALVLTGTNFTEALGGEGGTEDEAINLSKGASSVGDIEKIIAGIDQKIEHRNAVQRTDEVL